ncbi:BTAD domain-containing putative transcriptional regulator [Nonomuraea sp. NPDC050786]|uniref:AfsR/SARP family transcriptional regulator n=1 Tax=Nonomuraea sp. NPDC050786 TaxID=3154840 RepID=UPI003410C798
MGDSLTLLLLGPPDLAVGGAPVGIRSAKTRALLCYLAAAPGPRPRAELAALLWGERPDANARGSLRLALSELRKEVGGWLDITREHVSLRAGPACFVDHRRLTQAPTVAEALRLWRGDFLDGVSFGDAPAFADWLESERRRVRLLLRDLLVHSGTTCASGSSASVAFASSRSSASSGSLGSGASASSGCSDDVVRLARIVAGLDPYDEEAHRLLMRALAEAGNRAAALTCYDELRRRLATELGVEPAPETLEVRRQLLPRALPAPRVALPVPGTELIGRDADVRRLRALLAGERLVTLLGPGGIGKTRLAIAAASNAPDPHPAGDLGVRHSDRPAALRHLTRGDGGRRPDRGDGGRRPDRGDGGRRPDRGDGGARPGCGREVAFVSFAGVRPEAAVTTLARRLGVDLSPPRPATELLLAALAHRTTLLVLDNLDHLPAFDRVVGEILRTAPEVRVLATSRRRLDLPGQVTVQVEGLSGPAAEALFAVRAVRAQPSFDADREAADVAAICAVTGGLPLAVELAAGLLRAIPCAELASRLSADPVALLSTAGPAARPRHAGMRTVFETSWRLLDPACRSALAALSVFGGGCTLHSALEVAATTPQVLVRLVDQSMLHLTPSGRYALHPLIQQFAAAHLREDPEAHRSVRERHAAHFAGLLDHHAPALHDASDTEVTRVLGAETDNIRLAWAASGEPRFLDHYWTLCLRLRLYEESAAIVRRHLARGAPAPHLRARWLRMAGVSAYQLARVAEATQLARAALDALGEPLPASPTGLATATLTAAAQQAVHRALLFGPRVPPSDHRVSPFGSRAVPSECRAVPSECRAVPSGRRALSSGRRVFPSMSADAAGAEAAQALALLARLAYHEQDLPTMLAASLRQLNAAERATDPSLRAEAYANFAAIARIAGRHRLARRYGTLSDTALAEIRHPTDAVNRARLSRGLDQLHSGAFERARQSFAEGRARTLDPRMAENCAGMLAETALWQGDFAAAADLYAETEELAVRRVGGDDIGRHWCLTGRAEALLRMDAVPPERIAEVLAAARASTDRRRTYGKELGLRDGPVTRTIQELRLITAAARLDLRVPDARGLVLADTRLEVRAADAGQSAVRDVLARALVLARGLPAAQPGMLECWAGLAELLSSLGPRPDRATTRLLHAHLRAYQARYPGAAARIGWARALVLAAAGKEKAARRAAAQAMAAAERLATPYDHRRAARLAT